MEKPEFVFGEGKISGVASLFLSILCLGGVLCFRFPENFTTPELRQLYDISFLRTLLSFFLLLSFILGVISFILSAQKRFSVFSLGLVLVSLGFGGSGISVPETVEPHRYWGLDWFVLDLLVLTLIFVPVERMFARLKNQRILRTGWKTDTAHFFVSHLLVQTTTALIMIPALLTTRHLELEPLQRFISTQPRILQFIETILVADLMQYWIHRLFHGTPFLWKFHAIHHSATDMDWLAGSRIHFFDVVITRGLALIPIFALGFSSGVLEIYLVFVAFWATLIHANLKFKLAFLNPFLVTPLFHHWHHAAVPEAVDKNFAVHLPFLDHVFGTYYLPKNQWPEKYGILGTSVPNDYLGQWLYPFRVPRLS